VAAVEREPAGGLQALDRQAGEQRHSFGLLALDFAAQARGLGDQWETGLLGAERSALEDARFVAAFVAFPAARAGCAFGALFALAGGFSTARWRFREKRPSAVAAPGARCCPAEWAGCL
jgi:hypothetical protein